MVNLNWITIEAADEILHPQGRVVKHTQGESDSTTNFLHLLLNAPRPNIWVVVRIADEALANVRKHSCVTDVGMRFDRRDGHWQLAIQDNGLGFPFSGKFSQSELNASGRGPLVIIACVDSIGGELTLESMPGRGSRLEITFQ